MNLRLAAVGLLLLGLIPLSPALGGEQENCSEKLFGDYTADLARLRFRASFGCHRGHHAGRFRVVGKIRRCVAEECSVKTERTKCNVTDPCRLKFSRKHPDPEAARYKWRVRYRSLGQTEITGGAKVVAECTTAFGSELCN